MSPTRTVVRLRHTPGGRDHYGDPIASTTTRSNIDRVRLAPRFDSDTGEADRLGRHGVIIGYTLYRRGDPIDLRHGDQIEVDGVVFDIEGEPGAWFGSRVSGSQAALRRAEG